MFDEPLGERANMPYLVDMPPDDDPRALGARYEAYQASLRSAHRRLPYHAFEFAAATWHYDPTDHRCPHDAWVESVLISEPSSGKRRELRRLQIEVELLGAYHDGRIRLTYSDVRRYSFSRSVSGAERRHAGGHGDWLIDEVCASENATDTEPVAVHEVRFSTGAAWTIEAQEITYEWIADRH